MYVRVRVCMRMRSIFVYSYIVVYLQIVFTSMVMFARCMLVPYMDLCGVRSILYIICIYIYMCSMFVRLFYICMCLPIVYILMRSSCLYVDPQVYVRVGMF